jgi:hypothetical protein
MANFYGQVTKKRILLLIFLSKHLVRTNSISETLGIADKQLITKYILPNIRKSSNNFMLLLINFDYDIELIDDKNLSTI